MGLLEICLFAVIIGFAACQQFQIQSGFEFVGTVEGKVFVRPIYDRDGGSDNLNYQQAIIKCRSAGYNIATIESKAQMDLLRPSVCTGSRWAWIDGVDFQTADNYFSLNTGKNLTFFEWVSGRPIVGDENRRCMRLSCTNSNIANAKMWDVPCTDSYLTVLCQIIP